jgi:hypothetical protein
MYNYKIYFLKGYLILTSFFTTIEDENIAYHVGDKKENVDRARENLAKKYNYDNTKLCYMQQIHSNIVQLVEDDKILYKCDGLVTDKKNTPLMVMVADCIPILFYDKVKKVIGVAHAGRVGTFENISKNTIQSMQANFDCNSKDIVVTLGPSIQKCCYEVSLEIAEYTKKQFGEEFVENRNIDLQGINKKQLLAMGIDETNIFISDICTRCSNEPYFSYRKDNKCGRFAGVLVIK